MSDDLVGDLRLNAEHQLLSVEDYRRAANRIEELQAALRDLSDGCECCPVSQAMRRVARKALEGKDDR